MGIEIPKRVPVMMLPEVSLFPGMMLPLFIFEPRYRQMLDEALNGGRMFAVAMLTGEGEEPESVAGVGLIRASVQNDDGSSHVILNGLSRVMVTGVAHCEPYPEIDILTVDEADDPSVKAIALAVKVKELAGELIRRNQPDISAANEAPDDEAAYVAKMGGDSFNQLADQMARMESPGQLADMLAPALIADPNRKQELLATLDVEDRLDKLIASLLELGGSGSSGS
jgi:Lon protease-like protein